MSSSERRNEKISSPVAASFFIVNKGAEKSISPELCAFIQPFFATSKFWIWSRIFSWRGEDPDDLRLPLFRILISGPVLGPYNNLGVMYTPIKNWESKALNYSPISSQSASACRPAVCRVPSAIRRVPRR